MCRILQETLDETFKALEKLRQKNKSLTVKVSRLEQVIKAKDEEKVKEKEIKMVETQFQIDRALMPKDEKIAELMEKIAEKDSLIAEKQARVEKLCEDKTDSSLLLATSLGEKEVELARMKRDLNSEQHKVKAFTSQVANLREQLKDAERYEVQYHEGVDECKRQEERVQMLETELDAYHAAIKEKEQQLISQEIQLNEARAAASEVMKVKDHSKVQSRQIMSVKQELDATKVSKCYYFYTFA